ncbi:Ubiquitin-protein ligase [Hirschfeldia incana]|nr:Ubiquitin-protein ligase [Hirschfeldia incana]KAJ0253287.1 Ubiquitin-protein ligase [Hirschfeldia incana]KAJ0253288.1 Ubiquitin-protein ligase [Hirschfeldia incana]
MGEVAVFVETNLGTRIAMTVSLDITSPDFKRKLEETHASCLPSLGEIRVHGLMVQRKSHFYYLAQSVPIKYIFRGNHSQPWFIHAEARLVNISPEPSISNSSGKYPQGVVGLIHGVSKKTKKSLAKPIPKPSLENKEKEFDGSETMVRSSLSTARAAAELNSKCFIPKTTPEREAGETASESETISKKLMVAANNIRMQGKSSMSCSLSSSIFRSKNRIKRCVDGKTLASLAKFMVFEIPDTED